MSRIIQCGLGIAVVSAILAVISGPLALPAIWPLLLAAAIVLVPGGHLGGRAAAYLAGLVVAWIGFALRAGVLPDIPLGRALAIAIPVVLVTALAGATAGRVPLWAGLVGVAAFFGTYEAAYVASPTAFMAESLAAITSALLASAIGFLAGAGLAPLLERRADDAPVAPTEPELATEQGV